MDDVLPVLNSCGQAHILQFWSQLNDDEKRILLNEIEAADVLNSCQFFANALAHDELVAAISDAQLHPIDASHYASFRTSSPNDLERFWSEGLRAIAFGEVAVVLLAGGQGTRLGVEYPKGMYDVGLLSGASLFQLQAERILRLQQLAKKAYPDRNGLVRWFVMASGATRGATESFFREHGYFGLAAEQMRFFNQGTLPCFSFDGKILMDSKSTLAKAPDGNGGLYRALAKADLLADFASHNIRHVHVYCVDNILVRVADPTFIGFCITNNADCAAKVVEKKIPEEPIGVICRVSGNGHQVIEYSEIPPALVNQRDKDTGLLSFRAGNIANHYFSFNFLKDVIEQHEVSLSHHVAKKKIPFLDNSGNVVKPDKPNGIKMEKFVFDVFPFAKRFHVWEVAREDEFSPLKNSDAAGVDCPRSCRRSLYELHHRWLKRAGVDVGAFRAELPCEISSLVSYAGEDIESSKLGPTISPPVIIDAQFFATPEEA